MKTTNLISIVLTIVLIISNLGMINAQDHFNFRSTDSLNIFLLRGLTRESGHWGPSFTANIKAEFPNATITMLDLPGSGEYYNVKAGLTINKIMEFMREKQLENIEARKGRNVIMVTSLGGMVAVEWIEKHPEDFQGLVMISSSFKGICTMDERANPAVRGEMIKVLFEKDLRKREMILLNINSNDTANFEVTLEEWIDIQKVRPMSKANIIRQTIAGMRHKLTTTDLNIPVLVIGSKGDRLVSPSCISKVSDAFNATLVWNDTAGHGIPVDAPEWLVSTFKTWMDTETSYNMIATK